MSDDESSNALSCKVVLIGESGVGKTCIMERFVNNTFCSVLMSTTGASFKTKLVDIEGENQTIKFEIWDTAGQERFRSLAKVFYKNATVCILVYDITRRASFDELKKYWVNVIRENTRQGIVMVICGNKNDQYELEEVPEKEAMAYANEIGAIFKTTSAKTYSGIEDMFKLIGKKVLHPDFVDTSSLSREQKKEMERRTKLSANKTKKGGCC